MEIKWLGTATIAFAFDGRSILFDPFVPMNYELPLPTIEELANMGDIFITHGHFDHLMYAPKLVQAGPATVYCSETAAATLLGENVHNNRIVTVKPGDIIKNGPFTVKVYKGAHIRFDLLLIFKTLFGRRTRQNLKRFRSLFQKARRYPKGEVLVFQVEAGGKKVLHMGSLNLEHSETYPTEVNILTLPFQGRSDLNSYTMKIIEKLKPKALFLHHFDDAFPPISSPVNTSSFSRAIAKAYPKLPVIVPEYSETIII